MAFTSTVLVRTRQARKQKRSELPKWSLIAAEILTPILLLAAWWMLSANSTNTFFPPLQAILARGVELVGTEVFWTDLGVSVGNLVVSYVLACVIGLTLGLVIGAFQPLAWAIEPTIHFFRAIPPVALVPIFISLIGFGNETRILSITLSALFPVLISTVDGLRGIESTLGMVSKVYRVGPFDRLFSVMLPAASPRILSGMQVSIITAFVVMIASEMLGSSVGLGARTLLAQQSFMISDMWVGILVLGIIGYAATALFVAFRRRVLRWYIASQQQEKNL